MRKAAVFLSLFTIYPDVFPTEKRSKRRFRMAGTLFWPGFPHRRIWGEKSPNHYTVHRKQRRPCPASSSSGCRKAFMPNGRYCQAGGRQPQYPGAYLHSRGRRNAGRQTPCSEADGMKSKIISCLYEIWTAENVRIVYACESGSRAWGFPSA